LVLGPEVLTPGEDAGVLNLLWNEFGPQVGDQLVQQWKNLVDLHNPLHRRIVLSVLMSSLQHL
jgi:hypothetical protein